MMMRGRPALMLVLTALALARPPAAVADGLAGPYLAGRAASAKYDYRDAAQYYALALAADPGNPMFLEGDLLAYVAMGDYDKAKGVADEILSRKIPSQLAELFTFSALAGEGKFADILASMDKGATAAPLADGLIRAWSELGSGNMTAATEGFDALAKENGAKSFALYHKALALASVGDFEGADKIFSGDAAGPLAVTRRGVIAHAEILSQLERTPDAIALLDKTFGTDPDPSVADLRARLAAGTPVPFDVVTGAGDGIAETLYGIAAALSTDTPDAYTLAYSQFASHVRPGFVEAILLSASILEQQGQFDLADATYNQIAVTDPAHLSAEIGRAQVLVKAGKADAAIEVLQQLTKSKPDNPAVWSSLGDVLRRQDRFAEAVEAYGKVIAGFASDDARQWPIYYARGVAYERQKLWDPAEADFRKSLALSPDQPMVLNYLGYGLLERKEKLTEAMAMIQRAVVLRPDDGYIVDSLGWAQFQQGHYQDAARTMQKAIALLPADPVVNDHVGDVYWAVGRKREAEFQWRRSLSYKPTTEPDPARVRRKIEIGLDAVLKEEGAPPLAVSANGN